MADRLLMEDGSLLLQEDGSSDILLELSTAPADMTATLFDGVNVSIQIALSSQTGDSGLWDSGVWNGSTWGPDLVWNEVARYCRSFTTTRGFQRDLAAWNAGAATVVLDNRDGRFSPSNLAGPYVTAGVTGVRPWRPIRIITTFNDNGFTIFRGYVLAWEESFDNQGGQRDAYVTLPCTDELGHLAGFNGFAQNPVGLGETSGQRIQRILNNAGHTGPRNIDLGRSTVQATTLAQNTVTELKLTADSEGGALFVDDDGTVCFEHKYALLENERSNTVQALFSDSFAGGGPTSLLLTGGTDELLLSSSGHTLLTGPAVRAGLPYADCVLAYNGDLVANYVQLARASGTVQVAADAASRALYGDLSPSTANRNDLVCETDAQVAGLAELYLLLHKDPEQLITQITIKPRDDPDDLFPQIFDRRVRDLISVTRRPIGAYEIDRDAFIAGITHTVDRSNWVTTFDLWSATPIETFGAPLWDSGTWNTSQWFA